jgi:hypothetical protein
VAEAIHVILRREMAGLCFSRRTQAASSQEGGLFELRQFGVEGGGRCREGTIAARLYWATCSMRKRDFQAQDDGRT